MVSVFAAGLVETWNQPPNPSHCAPENYWWTRPTKGHRLFGMDQFMIGRWECSFELSCLMNSLVMIFIAFSEMIVEMWGGALVDELGDDLHQPFSRFNHHFVSPVSWWNHFTFFVWWLNHHVYIFVHHFSIYLHGEKITMKPREFGMRNPSDRGQHLGRSVSALTWQGNKGVLLKKWRILSSGFSRNSHIWLDEVRVGWV